MLELYPKPDYKFYKYEYSGTLSPDEFEAQLMQAFVYVVRLVQPNAVDELNYYAFQTAVCSLIDYYNKPVEQKATSWKVGQTSMSYAQAPAGDPLDIAKACLAGSGLLCRSL